jgi:hypothetical protein
MANNSGWNEKIGLISSLITIFVFITGIAWLGDLFKFPASKQSTPIPSSETIQILLTHHQTRGPTKTELVHVVPAPTVTPTALVMSTLVPPTPTEAAFVCAGIDSDIARYWSVDLGCPAESAYITWASFTPFQRGFMMWRSDTRQIYGFFDGAGWDEEEDRFVEGMPDRPTPNRGDPPLGLRFPSVARAWSGKLMISFLVLLRLVGEVC